MTASEGPIILVVEDNVNDEALAIRAFKRHMPMARISVARNGKEAIDRCANGTLNIRDQEVSACPDLVLLDLKLPLASGHEVLSFIRQCDSMRLVPVVVFSSSDERSDIEKSYALGANTYIQKPMEYEEYLNAIEQVCQYWFKIAALPGLFARPGHG